MIGDVMSAQTASEVAGRLCRSGIDEEFVIKFKGNINTFTDVFFHGMNLSLYVKLVP